MRICEDKGILAHPRNTIWCLDVLIHERPHVTHFVRPCFGLELLDRRIGSDLRSIKRCACNWVEWRTMVDEKDAENVGMLVGSDVEPVKIQRSIAIYA